MAIQALYLHIPFCHAKCAYCDFDSCALRGAALDAAADAYVQTLLQRIDAFGCRGALAEVRTVYIGGGTPTAIGGRLLRLVERVRRWCTPVEVTCEANPESFREPLAYGLAQAGVTRISLGVQSLDDAELRRIGRIHSSAEAQDAAHRAQRAGLNVSLDLMCGLPGQTAESWRRTLEGALALVPDHISVYPLTIEEGTPLALCVEANPALEPDEDFQAQCMERARAACEGTGMHPYEVASYAQPGKECAHNIAYWTGASYLGLGRSAASMLAAGEYATLRDLFPAVPPAPPDAVRARIVQRDDGGTHFDVEFLTEREQIAEDLMLGMRMTRGVDAALLDRARAVIGGDSVDDACETACAEGLATWSRGRARLYPTQRGWLMGNELYGLMWGLADTE